LVLRTLCEEHIRRESRGRQRKLAFFSARALHAAQNDVKFVQTHAGKVSLKPLGRLAGSKGRALGVSPLQTSIYKTTFLKQKKAKFLQKIRLFLRI